MKEAAETPAGNATEGTWAIPLLVLIPVAVIGMVTDLSTVWRVVSWIMWSFAAVLTLVGWIQVLRYGVKGARGWSACVLTHCVLVWQMAHLVLNW
ncbi:hypothetical protein Stsp01_06420 [Streptomyces sp. NBRC 13847]|nr:hypothetical protein Stsp01_06420 [Streptomyces sp. NBRC 13847]